MFSIVVLIHHTLTKWPLIVSSLS